MTSSIKEAIADLRTLIIMGSGTVQLLDQIEKIEMLVPASEETGVRRIPQTFVIDPRLSEAERISKSFEAINNKLTRKFVNAKKLCETYGIEVGDLDQSKFCIIDFKKVNPPFLTEVSEEDFFTSSRSKPRPCDADLRVYINPNDWFALIKGELSEAYLLLTDRISAAGDVKLVHKLNYILNLKDES